jgi:hypothetical protein
MLREAARPQASLGSSTLWEYAPQFPRPAGEWGAWEVGGNVEELRSVAASKAREDGGC